MVPIMVNALMRLQMRMVQNIVNLVSLDPQDVPLVIFNFFVTSLSECFKHTISEVCLESDMTEMCIIMILFDILSEVLRHFCSII
jgi:hypothetical protein